MFEIYKITNIKNNKAYVGLTGQGTEKRFAQHQISNSHIGKAIRKYTVDNFRVEILVSGIESIVEAGDTEKFYIRWFDSFENGYNATTGGEMYSGFKRSKKSIQKHLENTDRAAAEMKRQQTVIKKYGYSSPMYKGSPAAQKRLDTLGKNGLADNGKKISAKLKGRTPCKDLRTFENTLVNKIDFDKNWFYVGRTAKRVQICGEKYDILDVHNDFERFENMVEVYKYK